MEESIEGLKLRILTLELELNQKDLMNSKILEQSSKLIDKNYMLKDKVLELELEVKRLHEELEGETEKTE